MTSYNQTKFMSPQNGQFYANDGSIVNLADLLANAKRMYITDAKQVLEGAGIFIGISFPSKNEAEINIYDEVVDGTPTATKKLIPTLTCNSNNEAVFVFPHPQPFSDGLYVDIGTLDYAIVQYVSKEEV